MNKEFANMQKLAFGKKLIAENDIKTKSELKAKIAEMFNEAKKKKDKDVAPQEDVEIDNVGEPAPEDTITPETSTGGDIDPTVKAIQDSLQKAFANAKTLGDEKLINQIGNTITMLVRTQVLGAQGVNENKLDTSTYIEPKEMENILEKIYHIISGNRGDYLNIGDDVIECLKQFDKSNYSE